MSLHNDPRHNGAAVTEAMNTNGFDPDKPSMLSDAFRIGWEAAVNKAAYQARNSCLVPPDGGSPTQEEADNADRAAEAVLMLATPTGDK